MQAVPTEMYNHQPFPQAGQSSGLEFPSKDIRFTSYSAVGLDIADPFAGDIIPICNEVHTGIHGDGKYGNAPCDGPTVWYCSSCGDGPIGSWNPCCTSCGHAYCGACTVEAT